MSGETRPSPGPLPRWLVYAVLLGLYLTIRGYHSFDGDQAYRLPLLLHRQDPQLYADDSFVRAFDAFNPHRGWLLVLDLATRPLGLAAGLFALFVFTFGVTCIAVDRLARGVWPELGSAGGLAAIGLILAAKAGNIGTNHLFEAMVLDRQVAFALGWLALAQQVVEPARGRLLVMAAIGAATLVHPSAGLQLGMVLAASSMCWCLLGRWTNVGVRDVVPACLGLAVAVIPGLAFNLASGPVLLGDMPARDFWLLSVELQGPQHMLPHLWRMPQWLAFGSYLALAALAACHKSFVSSVEADGVKRVTSVGLGSPAARVRLVATLVVIAAGLGVSWYAIEMLHAVRVTVFQPFRMATVSRGIAVVLFSGHVVSLWRTGKWLARMRAILIAVAVAGDWLMVVVTLAEMAVSAAEAVRIRALSQGGRLASCRVGVTHLLAKFCDRWVAPTLRNWDFARIGLSAHPLGRVIDALVLLGMLAVGLNFLGHHDTEYGHIPLLAAISAGVVVGVMGFFQSRGRQERFVWTWTGRRQRAILAAAWAVPLLALLAASMPDDSVIAGGPLARGLIGRCRFAPVPADDIERLAIWCREDTPSKARFIGPPGPKTFRLWSQRSLAFNRAASPYDAKGLADWFSRFQDHVGFHGSAEEFVREYVADRHGFEGRYDRMSDGERAALALRQSAGYVIAPVRTEGGGRRSEENRGSMSAGALTSLGGPLELLYAEGRYAVYRVRSDQLVQRQR